jgi:hypothetical protein
MTERDWELYRLSVVEQLPEGPYKDATIAGIRHKLQLLDKHEPAPREEPAGPDNVRKFAAARR